MKIRLEFDYYNGPNEFPVTKHDVEYLRAISGWARDNPDEFKLALLDGDESYGGQRLPQ